MAAEFCPRCGTQRSGSFRFCRSCQFDFDVPPDAGQPDDTRSFVERYGNLQAAQPAVGATSKPAGRSGAEKLVLGIFVLVLLSIGGYVALQASQGNAGSPSTPATSVNVPPAGQIWFGTSFDATTFEIRGRTSTVAVTKPFAFVAQVTHSIDAADLLMRISWNGALVANNKINATGSGELWGFSPGPLFQAGSWRYELTDIGGNVLASGTVTAK